MLPRNHKEWAKMTTTHNYSCRNVNFVQVCIIQYLSIYLYIIHTYIDIYIYRYRYRYRYKGKGKGKKILQHHNVA